MRDDIEPRISEADRIDNGVLVTFDDGKTAIYPAFFLYSAIDLCDIIHEEVIQRENK